MSGTKEDAESFDYVIVGSGMAGSTLANRLSEDGKWTVCVLEAGPSDMTPFVRMPAGFIKILFNPRYTWQFETEPSENLPNRKISFVQGRLIGGSGSINGMLYVRGQESDYDTWAQMGNEGWDYASVLPYFKRGEKRIGRFDSRYHGDSGPVPITDCDWSHPICDAFIKGAIGTGIPDNPDYNGPTQAGAGYYQRWIYRGRRMSPGQASLRPAMTRKNLQVYTNAHVTAVLFDGKRTTGVSYRKGGPNSPTKVVRARREVILTAGAINTPKLLQISGIGPQRLLSDIGVKPVHVLPGVGENFQDHYMVRSVARTKNIRTINTTAQGPRLILEVMKWLAHRPSVLSISPSVVCAFWKSDPALDRPDLQFVFAPGSYRKGYAGLLDTFDGMTLGTYQLRPQSTGYVRARTANPFDNPVIQPNYLAHETDRQVLTNGIRLARRLLSTPELQPYFDQETAPGRAAVTDEDIMKFAKEDGKTCQHPNGTCRMGPVSKSDSVVDPSLKVIGLEGLRVADASIMPQMTSGNLGAPTMMIAEKAADLILGHTPLAPARLS